MYTCPCKQTPLRSRLILMVFHVVHTVDDSACIHAFCSLTHCPFRYYNIVKALTHLCSHLLFIVKSVHVH